MNSIRMNEALTIERMREIAPSIFAMGAHPSRSERYTHLPTIDIVKALMAKNFLPFSISQSRSREDTGRDYVKHMIRFRHPEQKAIGVGDTIPEVVMINSHDGSSSYQLSAGLFRLVCSNGMMVADQMFESIRVRHTGDVLKEVVKASYRVVKESVKALEAPRKWAAINLSPKERLAFAEGAHHYRFADNEGNVNTPITPDQLLHARRSEDASHDLWSTMNVVQENLIRGGLTGSRIDPNTRRGRRRITTRPVTGIDQDVKLNKALWLLAAKMEEAKS